MQQLYFLYPSYNTMAKNICCNAAAMSHATYELQNDAQCNKISMPQSHVHRHLYSSSKALFHIVQYASQKTSQKMSESVCLNECQNVALFKSVSELSKISANTFFHICCRALRSNFNSTHRLSKMNLSICVMLCNIKIQIMNFEIILFVEQYFLFVRWHRF